MPLKICQASTDFATGDRNLAAIKRRGCWMADKSVRRYEKGSQHTRLLRDLPPRGRRFCVESARRLPAVVCGRLAPVQFLA